MNDAALRSEAWRLPQNRHPRLAYEKGESQ